MNISIYYIYIYILYNICIYDSLPQDIPATSAEGLRKESPSTLADSLHKEISATNIIIIIIIIVISSSSSRSSSGGGGSSSHLRSSRHASAMSSIACPSTSLQSGVGWNEISSSLILDKYISTYSHTWKRSMHILLNTC